MRRSLLFLMVLSGVVTASDAAMAQAATGGTKDAPAPTMVVPIRPRDEPARTNAVPTIPPAPPPQIRLRRAYPYRPAK